MRRLVVALIVVLAVAWAAGNPVSATPETAPPPIAAEPSPIALTLQCPDPDGFDFGLSVKGALILENTSSRAVMVTSIAPTSDPAHGPINLFGAVYGRVTKQEDTDAYVLNPLAQEETRAPFYGGLLMPGERLTVSAQYRPTTRREVFNISYSVAKGKYAGTLESLAPFTPYIMAETRPTGFSVLVPFTEARWKQIVAGNPVLLPLGPDWSPRAVWMLSFAGERRTIAVPVTIPIKGSPFLLEDARNVAAQIIGVETLECPIAYCRTLGGYIVFEESKRWVLSTPEQKERGSLLAPFPLSLVADADELQEIAVRVGDRQESFGTESRAANRIFWGKYPVYYGDGMYTQGEFLHLRREQLKEFLLLARERGSTLQAQLYFFRSRFYVLGD